MIYNYAQLVNSDCFRCKNLFFSVEFRTRLRYAGSENKFVQNTVFFFQSNKLNHALVMTEFIIRGTCKHR